MTKHILSIIALSVAFTAASAGLSRTNLSDQGSIRQLSRHMPQVVELHRSAACTAVADSPADLTPSDENILEADVYATVIPAPGTLTWVLAPKGELKATVTYTAPTKSVTGTTLESLSKVVLTSRGGADKYEFTNVVPGQVIVQEVTMNHGSDNSLTGVAYSGDTRGLTVEHKSIFCGKDIPLAPENVCLRPTADYTGAILSWDAVGEVGENGGYVDPSAVTYYVFDAFGSYYDPAIAETTKTSLTLAYPGLEGQDFFAYQVTAGYEENYSLDNSSNIAIVGTPAQLPFTESFANGRYDNAWTLDPSSDYSGHQYGAVTDGYLSGVSAFDGDNGFFYWLPSQKDVVLGIMSLRADISRAANPALEFRYLGENGTLEILLAGGTGTLAQVQTIELASSQATGWALATIPLSDYRMAGAVNFEIRFIADGKSLSGVALDDISVRDLADSGLRIVSASASSTKTEPGNVLAFTAHVHNQGAQTAETAAILWVNGVKVDEKPEGQLAADAFSDVEFEYEVPMNAPEQLDVRLSVEAQDTCDDYEWTISVKYQPYPTVSSLSADVDENGTQVVLTWNAPVFDIPEPQTVFEDFESADYEPMSISGAGDWKVYDGDGDVTINMFYETGNPYQTQPMAFQLFNNEVATPRYEGDGVAHSGSSFMVAPASYSRDNDNWLISPELSGRAQTIDFYAMSFIIIWPETFEVLYSTTGNNPEDFIRDSVLKDVDIPEVWTHYEADLPEGAKYFAIHHIGTETWALLVDDITYEAMPSLPADLAVEGYHVMRDNELLTSQPVKDTRYVDTLPAGDGTFEYTYTVVPVYNRGTGRGVQVSVHGTHLGVEPITVSDIDSGDVFFNLQGMRVKPGAIAPGVYIRLRSGSPEKVMLR